jgi:hypothetical protein
MSSWGMGDGMPAAGKGKVVGRTHANDLGM